MTEQNHWVVRVARSVGLPHAATLSVSARALPAEAWDQATRHCGVSTAGLAQAIASWFRMDVADLSQADSLATELLPGSVAREFNVFPLVEDERCLIVATADPCDAMAEQQVGFASGRVLRLSVAAPEDIRKSIEAAYAPDRAAAAMLDRIESEPPPAVAVIEQDPDSEEEAIAFDEDEEGSGPIVRLANMILEDAVTKGASDIHLQPLPTGGAIRLRIDGVLRSGLTVPLVVLGQVISRVKIMSRLDISDKMRPQDGRARIRVGGRNYDLRISTVPVRGGEKAVIRVLDPTGSGNLEDCGLPQVEIERLRRILRNRDGILVVTGPTGSGKTTTMYGALREISTEDVNIMTVEDPVEYELVGLTQIQVDPKKGVTFPGALKAILRQDPDVIFVGEIRDQATAEVAAQASLTGHLVLATVHANDAVGSIRRFLDLGLDAGTISETLRGALAQRLLRTFCTSCVQPAGQLDAKQSEFAERYGVRPVNRAVGCAECGGSGYRGRRPVVELLVPTPEVLQLVSEGGSHVDLTLQARKDGMRSLVEGALDLVAEGLTSLEEVERVTGEDAVPTGPSEASAALVADSPLLAEEPPSARPESLEPAVSGATVEVATGAMSDFNPFADEDYVPPPRVLIVDDDESARLLARTLIESRGWEADEATDGKSALLAIGGAEAYSLIVLDLKLGDINGLEILRAAKRTLQTAGTPVIVLTGSTDRDTERMVLMEGAADYVRKPIDPPIFLMRSQAVMRRARSE